jgi:hypothetical protein
MLDLGPDLPDDTLVEMVRLPTRIRKAAEFAGLKTIGISDKLPIKPSQASQI